MARDECNTVNRDGTRLVSAGEARRFLQAVALRTQRETCSLWQALDRVLCKDIVNPVAIPQVARATMDGYAVRALDTARAQAGGGARLKVTGRIQVGELPSRPIGPGEALAIPTGGCLPDGADAVIAIEWTREESPQQIIAERAVEPGRNVLGPGSDLQAGVTVLRAGTRLGPAEVATLAGIGCMEVPVYARPRVFLLSSGDEVCPPDSTPSPAEVRDQHQVLMSALSARAGCVATRGGIVPDRPEDLRERVLAGLDEHDVVLLSAGTSVGVHDFALSVLSSIDGAKLLFAGIDIRPGKPTVAVQVRGQRDRLLFGLPGFPTSAAIVFLRFIAPALRALGGEANAWAMPRAIPAILTEDYVSALGREDYVRVRFVEDADGAPDVRRVAPIPGGPAAISNLLWADGIVVVPADVARVPAGSQVAVLPLD